MASLLSVKEYAAHTALINGQVVQVPMEPALAAYDIDFTSGEAHGATLNAKTRLVRLQPSALCAIKVDVTAVAAATDGRYSADSVEFVSVPAAIGSTMRVSAITRA